MKTAPHRIETIRAFVQSGRGIAAAARELGMRPQHAWRLAKKHGLTKPRGRPRKWSDEGMLAALKAVADRLGRAPAKSEVGGDSGCPHATSYVERFGSWAAALHRIGLTPGAIGVTVSERRRVLGQITRASDIRSYWLSTDKTVRSA